MLKMPLCVTQEQTFAVMDTEYRRNKERRANTRWRQKRSPIYCLSRARLIADKCTDSVNNMNKSSCIMPIRPTTTAKTNFRRTIFSTWRRGKMQKHALSPACEDGRCSLIGFTAQGSDKWSRSFDIKPIEWKTSRQTNPDKSSVETLIQITTVDLKSSLSGGKLSTTSKDKTCSITYGWQPKGLASRSQGR